MGPIATRSRVRLRGKGPHGHRVLHDALVAVFAASSTSGTSPPTSRTRGNDLPQSERDHAGVVAPSGRGGLGCRRRSGCARPAAEEFYDAIADPHQVRDLARIQRIATRSTGPQGGRGPDGVHRRPGLVNESEIIHRMWPGGVQPETAQPYILTGERPGPGARTRCGEAPLEVVIYVPTQGASSATPPRRALGDMEALHGCDPGRSPMTFRAKAIRYGYKESEETRVVFTK